MNKQTQFQGYISDLYNAISMYIDNARIINACNESAKICKDKNIDFYGIIKSTLDEFVSELRRCLIYYDNQTGRKGFTRLIVTGGGSKLKGLDKYISRELGIPIEHLNPFNNIYADDKIFPHEALSKDISCMGLCVGLAMRI